MTMKKAKKPAKPKRPYRVGDVVTFRVGEVRLVGEVTQLLADAADAYGVKVLCVHPGMQYRVASFGGGPVRNTLPSVVYYSVHLSDVTRLVPETP